MVALSNNVTLVVYLHLLSIRYENSRNGPAFQGIESLLIVVWAKGGRLVHFGRPVSARIRRGDCDNSPLIAAHNELSLRLESSKILCDGRSRGYPAGRDSPQRAPRIECCVGRRERI